MLKPFFPSSQKKPYSAITVQVDRLTSEQYEADDLSGIVDLIEVIRLQAGGPTEAARAIRKKLWVSMLILNNVTLAHFGNLGNMEMFTGS